ncbi:unnamed protein product, partial [Ilex paraguariensis]
VLTSSCRFHTVTSTLQSNSRHVAESNSPLLRVLGSLGGSNQRNSYLSRRFFCSDSTDGSEAEPGSEAKRVEVAGEEADSNSSSAIVPTVFKPEDCLTVGVFMCT